MSLETPPSDQSSLASIVQADQAPIGQCMAILADPVVLQPGEGLELPAKVVCVEAHGCKEAMVRNYPNSAIHTVHGVIDPLQP